MITQLLINKILQLFVFVAVGFVLVRSHVAKSSDSSIISKALVYALFPATTISMFQQKFSPDIAWGLLYATVAALAINAVFILIARCMEKPCALTNVEKGQIAYSNSGNLIIPIVLYVLGEEWLLYSMPYIVMQGCLMFSHGRLLFQKGSVKVRDILLQPAIFGMALGLTFFIGGVRLPDILSVPFSEAKGMVGPLSMLVTGMLLAETDIKAVIGSAKTWIVLGARQLICPAFVLVALLLLHTNELVPSGYEINLILFLAAAAPTANTITQFAQIYGGDAKYSGTLNVLSTLCSIVTMPLMVFLFETIL